MTSFFTDLYHRLWLSYRSTLLGLLVAIVTEVVGYLAAGSYQNTPPWVHLVAGLILAPFLAWKDKAVKDGTIRLLTIALLALCLSACAFTGRAVTGAESCVEKDAALVSQVMQALSDVGEGNWIGALVALVPDPALRTCIIQAILDAVKVPPVQLPASTAAQLVETPTQRMVRRANAYVTLTR